MTDKQIINAGIDYTMRTCPVCIGGGAFEDKIKQYNRNPLFEVGATWAKENLIKEVINWMQEQVYQEYSGGPLVRLITDEMIENFKKVIEE